MISNNTNSGNSNDNQNNNSSPPINNNDLKRILDTLQSKTFKFIAKFILSGILLIFFASIVSLPKPWNIYTYLAEAINTFVSIVLGIVAMVMSAISLFFSFYNTKQSYDTHDDYLVKFTNITNSLNQTIKAQDENIRQMHKMSEDLARIDQNVTSRIEKLSEKLDSMEGFKPLQKRIIGWKTTNTDNEWEQEDVSSNTFKDSLNDESNNSNSETTDNGDNI